MQFQGGKNRLAQEIVQICERDRKLGEPFWDLCCGSGNIVAAARQDGIRYAVDIVPSLIALLRETAAGRFVPPAELSEETYKQLRDRAKAEPESDDPLLAFAGFGCSFGGKWYGGYARQKGYNFAAGSGRALLKKTAKMHNACIFICDDWYNCLDRITGIAYLDPEYAGTTGYLAANRLKVADPAEFWKRADALCECARSVFVSEYNAPAHWKEIARWEGYKPLNKGQRIERLFTRNA